MGQDYINLVRYYEKIGEHWKKSLDKTAKSKGASKNIPRKLNELKRKKILSLANSKKFASLPLVKLFIAN